MFKQSVICGCWKVELCRSNMPQTRPEYRKSKWEKSANSQIPVKLSKPLVEYDNFSSSDDDQLKAKELYSGEARRKVVLKSVSSAKASKVRSTVKTKLKKDQRSGRKLSTDYKVVYLSEKDSDLSKEKHSQKQNKDKINSSRERPVTSAKKQSRKRSRSRTLSFTGSDLSNDSMDRHMQLPHVSYDRRQYPHSPVRDSYINHHSYQPHSQEPRYTRNRSPLSSDYAAAPPVHARVPIIRRSITPPKRVYSPRRKDVYPDPHFANHDLTQPYQNRSRSPVYNHPSSYSANQG